MRPLYCLLIMFVLLSAGCGKTPQGDPPATQPPSSMPRPSSPSPPPALQRPPIDLGDVDSGILVAGRLAPLTGLTTLREEVMETRRGTLAMCTIHVSSPVPAEVPVRFEVTASRAFAERPVVLRMRVFREETPISEEYAFVLGKDANLSPVDASGLPAPRAFSVNALAGLDSPPESVLIHARGTAWLLETGTAEEFLDPRSASSDDHVSIISNPVRIHFESTEGGTS